MEIIKRLAIGLDLSPMDDTLLTYAAFLCSQSAIDRIYLVHTERKLDIPAELAGNYEHQKSSVAETIKTEIGNRAAHLINQLPQVQVSIDVIEGNPVKGLVKFARTEAVDLLLVGRKLHLKGSGVLPEKLLRSSKLSVLFVPENAEPKLQNIMVSLDFSDYSLLALDGMLHSALTKPERHITCLHVYQVPSGYITLGVSYEEFDQQMQQLAQAKFDKVLEKFPELAGRATLKLVKQESDENIGKLIVLEAKRAKADLLVVGAKGMSAMALFMLGSTTESVLRNDADIPLLVFKNRNEELGFLDALLSSQ